MTKIPDINRVVEQTLEHFGRVDVLINNAGQGYDAPIEKTNIDTFHYIFDLDVVGPLVAMQQVIPVMRKQGGGAIINISSGTALMYLPNMGAYSASKRALANISLTAREELKTDNIIVSVVYPYITLTDFEKNTIREPASDSGGQVDNAPFPPDTAEHVAHKILEGIEHGEAEIFAHEWMKKIVQIRRPELLPYNFEYVQLRHKKRLPAHDGLHNSSEGPEYTTNKPNSAVVDCLRQRARKS
jgi:short-subunit dehydrogenase